MFWPKHRAQSATSSGPCHETGLPPRPRIARQSPAQPKDNDKNRVNDFGMQYTPLDKKTHISKSKPKQHLQTPDVRSTVIRRSNLIRLATIPHQGEGHTTLRLNQRRNTRTIWRFSTPIGNIPNCKRAANTILSINTLSVGGHLIMI
jgi:hypothetical protein